MHIPLSASVYLLWRPNIHAIYQNFSNFSKIETITSKGNFKTLLAKKMKMAHLKFKSESSILLERWPPHIWQFWLAGTDARSHRKAHKPSLLATPKSIPKLDERRFWFLPRWPPSWCWALMLSCLLLLLRPSHCPRCRNWAHPSRKSLT